MPYKEEWVEPDVKVVLDPLKGHKVYVAYDMDEYHDPQDNWFCLNEDDRYEDALDIRDWPGYEPGMTINQNILAAYQAGDIYFENVSLNSCTDEVCKATWSS